MSNQNDERKRLQRLREEQLQARDPNKKDREKLQRISTKHRHTRKKLTVWSVLDDIPISVWYTLIGGLFAAVLALVMNVMVDTYWPDATWVGIASGVLILAGLVIGRFLGRVMEWRNNDWE